MRISARGRYALAATIQMASEYERGACMTVISISDKLGISKIYLEQVFALLRRAGLVYSVKGAQGGYQLARSPRELTALDVLAAIERLLFEDAEETVAAKEPATDRAMQALVFAPLDQAIRNALQQTTLEALVLEREKHKGEAGLMFFI
jgi:Rrf2 family protein